MIPVYIFTGFLDSGKTTAIRDFIFGMQEQDHKKILLIACEEGEEEYDYDELQNSDVSIRYLEDETAFTYEYALDIEKETGSECIIVEYNGMWNTARTRVVWDPEQILEIMLIDASTFDMYLNNLKALIADKIRTADLIIFNRCDDVRNNLSMYRRSARALNSRANIVFRNANGDIEFDPGDYLPYDPSADHIDITDDTFAAFYIDAVENPDRYIDKEVRFTGMVLNAKKEDTHSFILGRIALTCCSEDLSVFGFICDYNGECGIEIEEWMTVICRMEKEYSEKFDIWHPVCKVKTIEKCDAPGEKIINVK